MSRQTNVGRRAARACLGLLFLSFSLAAAGRARVALDGEWRFRLDPQDAGRTGLWYAQPDRIDGRIQVPGVWQAQGYGAPSGVLRHHYEGAAWYAKSVPVPPGWAGKRIRLAIGGAFTYTDIYVNGLAAGSHEGFSTPFRFDVTQFVKPGADNLVVLRVANVRDALRPERRDLAVRDTTEITGAVNFAALWGGIYRSVELEASEAATVESVAISTSAARPSARFAVALRNVGQPLAHATLDVRIQARDGREIARGAQTVSLAASSTTRAELNLDSAGARLWSPDEPNLYQARVTLRDGAREIDSVVETFGFREIRTKGSRILLNGKPIYLRGYGDDSVEPLTGAPPSSKQTYLDRMRIARGLGFNAVRFHSTTPPAECFEAADETGILVLAELPVVYQEYLLPHKDVLRQEVIRIVDAHRNHPSWFSFTLGNEFGLQRFADEQGKRLFLDAVYEMVALAKSRYPELLVSTNTGYLVAPMDVAYPYRGLEPGVPNIKHEYGGYYGTLPDFAAIPKFKGVLKPSWLVEQQKWVANNIRPGDYQRSMESSWRHYANVAKLYIERLRALNEFSGYFYWLINDFPAGTAEGSEWNWGWLNMFWEPKGITPAEGRSMNAAVLPLIDLAPESRTFWFEDGKKIEAMLSNFGASAIEGGTLSWELTSRGRKLASARVPIARVDLGEVARVGRIEIGAIEANQAAQLELTVDVEAGARHYTNRWNLWGFSRGALLRTGPVPIKSLVESAVLKRAFPFLLDAQRASAGGVLIATDLQPRVVEFLRSGGSVLLLARPERFGGRVSFFTSAGGALGMDVSATHPALKDFPHAGFPDLQFFTLLEGATRFTFDGAAPILTGLALARGRAEGSSLSRITLLSEGRVGAGKLLWCGLNVLGNLDGGAPEAVYLLDRLLRYVTSGEFQPSATISDEEIETTRIPYTQMIH
jgi:beta-galactosidase